MKANYHEVFNLGKKDLTMKLVQKENNDFYFECPVCKGEMKKTSQASLYQSGKYQCTKCNWTKTQ